MSLNLLKKVEEIAKEKYDGHYTIYKFTTHYKGCFGTLMEDEVTIRDKIYQLPPFNSFDELLYYMVELEPNAYDGFSSYDKDYIENIPIHGKKYKVWRGDIYLGVVTYYEDKLGGSFMIERELNGDKFYEVFLVDKWELFEE